VNLRAFFVLSYPPAIKIHFMRIVFTHIDEGLRPLSSDEAHVWSAPLNRTCNPAFLIDSERERAARLKSERIRNQFIAARAQLRIVLGRYLDLPPAAVPITYEPSGKPILKANGAATLHFNVSHSETLAVFAVTRRGRIGVDIERHKNIPNAGLLVERFFSPYDCDRFKQVPEPERLDAFFRAWTRKEAVLKAIGLGVQRLDQCDVTFVAGEPETVLRVGADTNATAKWFLQSWQPESGYDGAVAVELSSAP
jgi:4'-phosphopantetheinyl transferase